MPSSNCKLFTIGLLCLMVAVAGCSSFSPTTTATADESPAATTVAPSPTQSPSPEAPSRGGLLTVEIVDRTAETNESEIVQYNQTVFTRSPSLNGPIAEAISENATQIRDLSPQEVQQVESVANEYNKSTGEFIIRKNGTTVRISLGYEV